MVQHTFVIFAALLVACAGDDDDTNDLNDTDPSLPTNVGGGGGACDLITRIPADGTSVVSGDDDMSLDADGAGNVELRVDTVIQGGGGLSVTMRGSYQDDGNGNCIAVSNVVFRYLGEFQAGVEVPFTYVGDPTKGDVIDATDPMRFFVDVNEELSIVSILGETIEYMGTTGSFTFTELNVPSDGGDFSHTLSFDIDLNAVDGGVLNTAVQSNLTGTVTFESLDAL